MDPVLTSTEDLIVACANPFASCDKLSELTGRDIDWNAFEHMAESHRLLPLVHHHFSSLAEPRAPHNVTERARKAYTATAVRMAFLSDYEVNISDRFKSSGLRALSWKGPDLARRAYKDMALRPADDLDYLVHPADIPKAIDILRSLGLSPTLQMKTSTQSNYLAAGYEYIMVSPDGDLHVELATRPIPPPSPLDGNPHAIWESEDGALTAERYFVYLCMHGARHCWDRLVWISDLCAFASSYPDLSWPIVAEISKETHAETMLLSAIDLMKCVGCRSPRLQLRADRRPLEALLDHALHSEGISALEEMRRRLSVYSRMTDKSKYAARWLFAPTFSDWEAVPLASPLRALYWLIRPFRLTARLFTK